MLALDISSDRLVEFAIVFGLLIIDPSTRAIPAALMLGSILVCVTTFLIVGMFTDNHTQKSFFYDVGLMERAEAFFVFCVNDYLSSTFLIIGRCIFCIGNVNRMFAFIEFCKNDRGE